MSFSKWQKPENLLPLIRKNAHNPEIQTLILCLDLFCARFTSFFGRGFLISAGVNATSQVVSSLVSFFRSPTPSPLDPRLPVHLILGILCAGYGFLSQDPKQHLLPISLLGLDKVGILVLLVLLQKKNAATQEDIVRVIKSMDLKEVKLGLAYTCFALIAYLRKEKKDESLFLLRKVEKDVSEIKESLADAKLREN